MRSPMTDLIVVIPGIMGSVLKRGDSTVWGAGAILPNLISLGRGVKGLKLPSGIGDHSADDGVSATAIMPYIHVLPGLVSIDGYTPLIQFLRERFELEEPTPDRAGNLLLFPYDWRLSNVVAAERLRTVALHELARWCKHASYPAAKLNLICHSMGGLVARHFLGPLGGAEETRYLITLGTPYRGSLNAVDTLVNGLRKGWGPLSVDLSEFAASCPSIYQLLPTYRCIETAPFQYVDVVSANLPGVSLERALAARAFHKAIHPDQPPPYTIRVVKGDYQPTSLSAKSNGSGADMQRTYQGQDDLGDGTVPRLSSHPPEWESDDACHFSAEKHGSLQVRPEVHEQIYGILTSGGIRRALGGTRLWVDVPEVNVYSEPVPVAVKAEGESHLLPLIVEARDETGTLTTVLMDSDGEGGYSARLMGLEPGGYRVTVRSMSPDQSVESVTAIILVWKG